MGVVLGEQAGVTTGKLPLLIPDFPTFQLIIYNDCFPAADLSIPNAHLMQRREFHNKSRSPPKLQV
jgi:hypothetical protein